MSGGPCVVGSQYTLLDMCREAGGLVNADRCLRILRRVKSQRRVCSVPKLAAFVMSWIQTNEEKLGMQRVLSVPRRCERLPSLQQQVKVG